MKAVVQNMESLKSSYAITPSFQARQSSTFDADSMNTDFINLINNKSLRP